MHCRRLRRAALVLLAAGAGTGLIGCSAVLSSSNAQLIVYNGQHPQTTDALVTAFERRTGIRVAVRSDDEDVLAEQIAAEGSGSPADVIYTENSPALEYLQDRGLLARVDRASLAEVPARYESPDGDWVGVSARVSVLVYNATDLSPRQLPRSILSLAEPKWRGRLAIAPAETDFAPIVTSVALAYGRARTLAWLAGLKRNAGDHVYPDNETVTAAVNRGTVELAVINQYYWYRERAEVGPAGLHCKIAYFGPGNPGYVVDVSGAAVLRSSRHQAAAQRFLAFLVSRSGQELIAHGNSFEYPLGSGVTTAAPETPFRDLRPDPISVAELSDGSLALQLLREAQLL